MKIQEKSVVAIEYTLTSDEGEVIDSSEGGEPLTYIHGVGGLIPGLERELEGKGMGAMLKVRIAPEDAYGVRDDNQIARVPKTQMPKGAPLEVGMQFQAAGPEGVQVVTVVKVEDDAVWLDGNHPLAGMHLNFAVTVVSVRAATEEELEHGHVHGPGGHHH
jgi:FKBP-type peptidyl-prolyl cis-trans isomerase SlyD